MKRKLFVLFLYLALIIQPSQADWIYNPFTQKFSYYEPTGAAAIHAANHEAGGADIVDHDNLTGFVIGEHFLQSAIAVDANELTNTAGSLGLADHDTARAALGLAIGTDIPALAHAMASHSDDDTYDISTSGSATAGNGAHFGGVTNYIVFASNGTITLHGTARITGAVWVPASAIKAPGTKPATWKEWGISGVWEFSDGTDDTLVANLQFAYSMDMTVAPAVSIGVSTNTAVTSETSVWQLEYLYTAPGEDTAAAAQDTITVNADAVATADGLVVATFPTMDIPGATDVCIHMRIKRLGVDGNDDLTDTAELHGLCMAYTANKLGK